MDRRAFARIAFAPADGGAAATMHAAGFGSLSGVLRRVSAERSGPALGAFKRL